MIVVLFLTLFYVDEQGSVEGVGSASVLTGAVVGTPADSVAVQSEASITAEPSTTTNDIQVWQGQYYKGTEFLVGTFEFNFTVYDASTGGNSCYSKSDPHQCKVPENLDKVKQSR